MTISVLDGMVNYSVVWQRNLMRSIFIQRNRCGVSDLVGLATFVSSQVVISVQVVFWIICVRMVWCGWQTIYMCFLCFCVFRVTFAEVFKKLREVCWKETLPALLGPWFGCNSLPRHFGVA